ncbi:MAG TPA: hypothetical protein VMA13_00990 [Candidatus Saccharimonadales bacterium]|nr:hypothetical protein [Candidatus Saccharimonadales bacterium]
MGAWHNTSSAETIVFNRDGSYAVDDQGTHYMGTWQINGRILTLTVTNVTGPHGYGKAGGTSGVPIVHLDSHLLSLRIYGQTNSFSR